MKTEKQVRTWWIDIEIEKPGIQVTNVWKTHCIEGIKVIAHEDHLAIVAELDGRIQKLREALEFYAKHENWETTSADDLCKVKTKLTKDKESFGEISQPGEASKLVLYGGKIARQALAEDGK